MEQTNDRWLRLCEKTLQKTSDWWLGLSEMKRQTWRFIICFVFMVLTGLFDLFLEHDLDLLLMGEFQQIAAKHKALPYMLPLTFGLVYLFSIMLTWMAKAYRQLKEQSFRDTLTGFYNMSFLEEGTLIAFKNACRSREKSAEEEMFTVFVIDINNLKFINDTYGHPVGDIAINYVVDIIKYNFARPTDFPYRSSNRGDEIWVICSSKNPEKHLAKIREALSPEQVCFKIGNEKIPLSAAVGQAFLETATEHCHINADKQKIIELTKELITKADKEMYRHKKEIKSSVE